MNWLNNLKLSYLLIIFFSIFFFILQNPFDDLFSNFDAEFWNTYHALVFYSGYDQERFADPAHITYLLFSIYLKIINITNIAEIPTINELNSSDNFEEKINFLVFQSRIFGLIVNALLSLLIIKLFREFNFKYVLLITCLKINSSLMVPK